MVLEIVTPETILFKGEVNSVTLPGSDGAFQVLNNHAPVVSLLTKGTIIIDGVNTLNNDTHGTKKFSKNEQGRLTLAINSGTLEMNNNKVIVLAD